MIIILKPSAYRNRMTRPRLAISIGLVALCFAAYARLWANDFIDLDDERYVTTNPHVYTGLTAENAAWAMSTFYAGLWVPLVWLSFQLDASISHALGTLSGMNAAVYHGQNLFWHCAAVVLLFLTLARMTTRIGPSAVVAALFAVHPLHVESVAWATERKDVLSAFFWMLTIYAYLRLVEAPSFRREVLVFLSFALGLLAKPMLVTLPFALLLLDYWPLRRIGWAQEGSAHQPRYAPAGWRSLVLEKLPLFALAAAGGVVTFQAQANEGAVVARSELSVSSRLANATVSYSWYLLKTFWPSDLAVYYTHPMNNWSWPPVLAGAAILVFISVAAVATARRAPWFIVGWLWFLGVLVPVSGLFQVGEQGRADRFVYIPHIGLFIAIVWTAAAAFERLRVPIVVRVAVAGSAVAAMTMVTVVQVGYWKNSEVIWEHALATTEANDRAEALMGRALMEKYRITGKSRYRDSAIEHLREAVRLRPEAPQYQYNLGVPLLNGGDLDEAANCFRIALKGDPNYVDAMHNLGMAERVRGNLAEADRILRRALELKPQAADTLELHGLVLWDMDRHAEARAQWEAALAIDPRKPDALDGIGRVYLREGRNADAIQKFEAAVEMKPGSPRLWSNLGIAAGRLNRWDQAILAHRRAAAAAATIVPPGPELSAFVRRVAYALESARRIEEAAAAYAEAAAMAPNWPAANHDVARKLLTSPIIAPGDAATALELASENCQAAATPSAADLDLQAAALAALGRFDDAIATARQALKAAAPGEAGLIRARLADYEKRGNKGQ